VSRFVRRGRVGPAGLEPATDDNSRSARIRLGPGLRKSAVGTKADHERDVSK
jgi:hypothetical protein